MKTYADFFLLMRNRMEQSEAKYGPITNSYPHKVDALRSMMDRIRKYEQDGNTEWLVDAANFAMIEFLLPSHTDAHFRATGSKESPGLVLQDGQRAHKVHD